MKRKVIYLLFLSIGVVSLHFSSCTADVDYLNKTTFIYINSTNYIIKTKIGVINSKDTLETTIVGDGPRDVTHLSFVPPFSSGTVVYFDDKCLTYIGQKVGRGEGIVGIENYQWRKIAERHYEFTYTFTEEEAQKATTCP